MKTLKLFKIMLFSLKPEKKLPEKLAAKYILQTINALMFLHKKNIIHRDLKPENVLLSRVKSTILMMISYKKEKMILCICYCYFPRVKFEFAILG